MDIAACSRDDELEFKVAFKLLPSRTSFSRVTADLFFDGEKVDSLRLRILPGLLATDCSEFSSVLDMTGIPPGPHVLKVELYEPWSCADKLSSTSKELSIDHVPLRREDRLVRVPIVKSYEGTSIAIVSDSERSIHHELEEETKREAISQRDKW